MRVIGKATRFVVQWTAALIVSGIILVSTLVAFRLLYHRWDVERPRANWNERGVHSYRISVVSYGLSDLGRDIPQGTWIIKNGRIIQAKIQAEFPFFTDLESVPDRDIDIIGRLFSEAIDCVWLCGVTYDDVYGFPTDIGGGIIESGGIQVLEFEVLDLPDVQSQ